MPHTKGPWKASTQSGNCASIEPIGFAWWGCPVSDETKANARLIAAAPEMLTVLKRMIAAFNADEIDPMVAFATIEQAQGTIARAEGKDGAV